MFDSTLYFKYQKYFLDLMGYHLEIIWHLCLKSCAFYICLLHLQVCLINVFFFIWAELLAALSTSIPLSTFQASQPSELNITK